MRLTLPTRPGARSSRFPRLAARAMTSAAATRRGSEPSTHGHAGHDGHQPTADQLEQSGRQLAVRAARRGGPGSRGARRSRPGRRGGRTTRSPTATMTAPDSERASRPDRRRAHSTTRAEHDGGGQDGEHHDQPGGDGQLLRPGSSRAGTPARPASAASAASSTHRQHQRAGEAHDDGHGSRSVDRSSQVTQGSTMPNIIAGTATPESLKAKPRVPTTRAPSRQARSPGTRRWSRCR